ncbi:MAG: S8 family serine peptidase [Caldilineaceae bacterium]
MVQFKPDISPQKRDALLHSVSGELLEWLAPLGVAKVRIHTEIYAATAHSILTQLARDPAIAVVEADSAVEGAYEINDPDALNPNKTYTVNLLHLQQAWDYTTGSSQVVIAVLDTGLAKAHPEFAGRILPGYDFVNDDDDPEDDYGHGTHVAGIAAATINNDIGMAGICGGCSILPVKVLNDHNAGTWSGVAEGILYAVDHHANVIVLSLGSKTKSKIIEDAVNYASAHNVLIVAAAGNANSSENFYPAAFTGVLGVGATGRNDERWALSNYGNFVDVVAPGDSVYSTYNNLNQPNGGYTFLSGTSMATPHVAGLAGLLFSQAPTRTITDVVHLIETTAVDLGDQGLDGKFGYGRIDPLAALRAGAQGPLATAQISGTIWQDDDYNGLRGASELHPLSGVKVDIYDSNLQVVNSATSNAVGQWVVDSLSPDAYIVRAEVPTGMVVTGNVEIHITLQPSAHLENLNFGLAPLLTAKQQVYLPLVAR